MNVATKRLSPPRRTLCSRAYSEEELEALKAVDRYKRDNRRPFPALTEVLGVLRSLGWRKVL
jgi:hypothetical protein